MNSIKQKPYSQATGSSAGQEILRILWNKRSITVHTTARPWRLSWSKWAHSQMSHFIYFKTNLILSRICIYDPHAVFVLQDAFLSHRCHMTAQNNPPVSDQASNISPARSITKTGLSRDFSHSSILFSVLGPNILLTLTSVHVCPDTCYK